MEAERHNQLNPHKEKHSTHIDKCFGSHDIPVIATTDYMRAYAEQIRPYIYSSNSKNDYYRNMIRNSIIPQFRKYDDNVMLKFQTTIDNLNSTKIFADQVLVETKNKIFNYNSDHIKVKIDDLKNLIPVEYYVHHLFIDYKFDYKEIIKLFKSDSGKHIDSNTHKLTKNKNYLIITKND